MARPYSFPAHAQTLNAESVADVSRREVGAPLSQPDGSEAETEVVVGRLVIDCVVGHGRPGSGDSEVGIQVIANAHVVPLSILHYAQHDDVRGRERCSQERFRNASGVLDSGERVLVPTTPTVGGAESHAASASAMRVRTSAGTNARFWKPSCLFIRRDFAKAKRAYAISIGQVCPS